MSVLYAGPWKGEFGWELCGWNPAVRSLAKRYDRVVVASHAASEYLYEFADEFIPLEAEGWSVCSGRLRGRPPAVAADHHLRPESVLRGVGALLDGEYPRQWRRLAAPGPPPAADILCAFRPPKKHISKPQANESKSYPRGMCESLVATLMSHGLSVACFGGRDNWWFEGSVDLRGRPLSEQCAALGAAMCAVGPSSGTMHLASLCGCPHVTWYTPRTHPRLRERYERDWNPFGTPVRFLDGKPPQPADVVDSVLRAVFHRRAAKMANTRR